MAAYKRSAEEAAKAVNALLHFCDEDQQPLLDVIQDYFDTPDFEGDIESDVNDDDRGMCTKV